MEGAPTVTRVALATDAALQTFEQARGGAAQLLIVHHGLYWGERPVPLVGTLRRRIAALIEADLALYCAHLPLDAHPEVGNNAVLARRLGLGALRPFGPSCAAPGSEAAGLEIGIGGDLPGAVAPEELRVRCEARLGSAVRLLAFGHDAVRSLAIVSGAGADLAGRAAAEGYDAFLTGETSHVSYHPAREAGVHLLFGGHYATETWGVQALGDHIAERWGLEVFFCDAPTGF